VARSAFVEAIGQLRRGLLLIADLPDTRARKQLELDLQVALAAALRFPKGYAHSEVADALGRARSLILETEGAGTIAYFTMLFGLVGSITSAVSRKRRSSMPRSSCHSPNLGDGPNYC
jgi:hypothetical protein